MTVNRLFSRVPGKAVDEAARQANTDSQSTIRPEYSSRMMPSFTGMRVANSKTYAGRDTPSVANKDSAKQNGELTLSKLLGLSL